MARTHPVLAERGYACVRVDMRGNGDSYGVDEKAKVHPKEKADCLVGYDNWLGRPAFSQRGGICGTVGMDGYFKLARLTAYRFRRPMAQTR